MTNEEKKAAYAARNRDFRDMALSGCRTQEEREAIEAFAVLLEKHYALRLSDTDRWAKVLVAQIQGLINSFKAVLAREVTS